MHKLSNSIFNLAMIWIDDYNGSAPFIIKMGFRMKIMLSYDFFEKFGLTFIYCKDIVIINIWRYLNFLLVPKP